MEVGVSCGTIAAFLLGLFRECPPPELRALHIEFVGRALGFACGPLFSGAASVDVDLESELTSATSVDALLRLEAERALCATDVPVLSAAVDDEP